MNPYKDVIWNRKIDLIENHKAKVICKNGTTYHYARGAYAYYDSIKEHKEK